MIRSFECLSECLRRGVTARRIFMALAALLLAVILMQVAPFGAKGMDRLVQGQGTLDMRFGYSPEIATRLFRDLGPSGRSTYLLFLALDLVYMLCSAWFQSLTMSRLSLKAGLSGQLGLVNLLPWAKCLLDLAENLAVLSLLMLFPRRLPALVMAASCFTIGKWILYYGCLAILFGLGAFGAGRKSKPMLDRKPILETKGAIR